MRFVADRAELFGVDRCGMNSMPRVAERNPLGREGGGLGPELAAPFDQFETKPAPWVCTSTQASIDGSQVAAVILKDTNAGVKASTLYRVSFTCSGVSGLVFLFLGTSSPGGTLILANGVVSGDILSFTTGGEINIRAAIGATVVMSNLSVRQIL